MTRTLGNVAQVEFVVLAVLAIWHWGRSRIRGAGWAAVSFILLAGIGLAGRAMRYGWIPPDQVLLKVLVGVLLVVPYAFYRFAAAFDRPDRWVRMVAGALTTAALVATSGLDYFPLRGFPSPPGFTAFRVLVTVQWGFLFTFVAVRMWRAGQGQGETARRRMRLLAAAAAGLNLQVLVGAAGLTVHPWVAMVSSAVTVLMAGAFCLGFAPPAVLRLRWRRTHNEGFQERCSPRTAGSWPSRSWTWNGLSSRRSRPATRASSSSPPNMSVGQFLRTDPAEVIARVLAETGLPARALGIEITESVFMANTDRLGRAVADLKALGVSIAIDDFGSGFSSLGYLKRFPIDVIKVDSSFVRGIGGEPETALVRACLALAEALGLATVAEGVETADQAAWLARSGCDQVQGYFYSRPLEPADAEAFLVAESLRVGQEPLSRSSSSWTSTTAIPIVASEIP